MTKSIMSNLCERDLQRLLCEEGPLRARTLCENFSRGGPDAVSTQRRSISPKISPRQEDKTPHGRFFPPKQEGFSKHYFIARLEN